MLAPWLFLLLVPLAVLALREPRWAVLVLLAGLPAYLVRATALGVPSTLLELGIYTVLLVLVVRGDWRDWRAFNWQRQSGWLLPLALWLLAAVVAAFVAPGTRSALGIFKGWIVDPLLLGLLVFTVGLRQRSLERWVASALGALLLGAACTSLVAYAQGLWQVTDRLRGWYDSPNVLAMYLSPVLVAAAVWWVGGATNLAAVRVRYAWFAGLAAVASGLVLTGSYAAVASVVVGVAAGCLNLGASSAKYGRWLCTAVLVLGFSLPWVVATTGYRHGPAHVNARYGTTSSEVRLVFWREATAVLAERPWLGLGLGGWQPYFLEVAERHGYLSIKNAGLAIELWYASLFPHNLYLATWLALGLPGVSALIWVSLRSFASVPAGSLTGSASLAALAAILVQGAVDTPLFKNDLAVLWWLAVLGTAAAAGYRRVTL